MLRTAFALVFVLGALAVALLYLQEGREPDASGRTSPPTTTTQRDRGTARKDGGRELRRARCPEDVQDCEAATGRVIFIESVDPDGDGDLHVVVAGGSVTAPGVTVLDVAPDLRPKRDPRVGDRVTGAGPVFRGSFGQRQIQVTEFRVQRR